MDLKLLVVDDEKFSCEMVTTYLTDLGYAVDKAFDAKSAMALIEKSNYDIILTDKNMPGLDESTQEGGMQLLKYVRTKKGNTQVVMMTGYASIETAIEALKLGAFDYITKPMALEVIDDIIKRILDYRAFINPENTINIYMTLHNEILTVLEKSYLSDEESHKLIRSIDSKIDHFFQSQKNWERIIIEQREALSKIASYIEQLKNKLDLNEDLSRLFEKIYTEIEKRV